MQRLVRSERYAYVLTGAGRELADVYDQAARSSRAHNYPCAVADFVTRIQHTLALLADQPLFGPLSLFSVAPPG